jgi:hypothetical protein
MTSNAEKVRDIAAALEIAAWLADHRQVADDQLLIAASDLLQHFDRRGWHLSPIGRSEP